MVQNYIVDKLTLADLNENGKVVIPNFQRGVVWTKQHRKEFIETVKTGDPFGVVLVYQESPTQPYYLIDGLQRLSSLKAYMDNPIDFIDENDKFINQEKLRLIFQKKYEIKGLQLPQTTKLEKEEKAFLKKLIACMKAEKNIPNEMTIWPQIAVILGVDKNTFDIITVFSDFYRSFLDNLKLPEIIIHAIVYQGPKDRLPSVFETLNTSSVSLTKYEIFSSQWSTNKLHLNDDELINKVWSKYEALKQSSSFEVEVSEESIKNDGMTLFEYCFGFSELLCDPEKSYSFLFNKGKKNTDPTGFEILALACGLPVNKADELNKDEYLGNATGLFLQQLKEAIVDSINIVATSLSKWIFDLKGTPIKNSSTYQIYYMIASVIKNKYEIDTKNKVITPKDDNNWISNFRKNAFKWYFYHQIIGFWNQHRQVSDLKNIIDGKINDTDYSAGISTDTWKEALTNYINDNRDNFNTRSIPTEEKLFLNYLYKLLIDEDANRSKYFVKKTDSGEELVFDIEHIVPFDKFSKFNGQIAMSVLGNLCYLPVKDNRSKRDHTIFEYALDRPSLTFNQEFLDMIDYPSRESLNFIDCTIDQFKTPFETLVKNREKKMLDKFIKLIQ